MKKQTREAKKKLEKMNVLHGNLSDLIDEYVRNGFWQATKKELLAEAKSKTHLRSIIGRYQRTVTRQNHGFDND